MHPTGTKMYRDLCELYWWLRLKQEVTDFVAKCLTCQQKLAKLYISEIVGLHGYRFRSSLIGILVSCYDFGESCMKLWVQGERRVLGPELVSKTEDKVILIRDRLKTASGRQKSYANLKRHEIEYFVGDFIFLKVSPWNKVLRFNRKGKLSPRFIGPYRILKQVGSVTYHLELPLELDRIHNVFHVSMLTPYPSNPSHIIPVEEIEVRPNLTFEEDPVQILDPDVKVLRKKSIPLVKVL
ncbi:uncharacterized protein [Gossypium hirsutum]|uniref:DNA/RNA polymerases superfamily protein n=1 Tax=Gossypium hirsutum TaxID=3635 RepID=A0A1U8JUJ3_GOSHI|nr:uncharacterized protein LOC107909148 [Gossypium hirsutum]